MAKKKKKHEFNEWDQSSSPSASAVEAAGHEMKVNPPAILAKTRRKKGKRAANKQRIAIMLSKARRAD